MPRKKPITQATPPRWRSRSSVIRRRRYADTADVCDALVARLLALGLKIDTESENCIDIVDALDQVVLVKCDAVTTLNCTEADLVGTLRVQDEHVSAADETAPMAATVRDLHALIRQIDPEHRCSVDNDLGFVGDAGIDFSKPFTFEGQEVDDDTN